MQFHSSYKFSETSELNFSYMYTTLKFLGKRVIQTRDRQTDSQTDRQTETERQRQTDRDRHRETARLTEIDGYAET